MVGNAFTVTVVLALKPHKVYVITAVPPETPVTSPVEGLTVATDGVADDQVPPAKICDNEIVLPATTLVKPLISGNLPPTKLLAFPAKEKLLSEPLFGVFVLSNKVVIEELLPLATP